MKRRRTFSSPEELWQFGLDVVADLRAAGSNEAADVLEQGVRFTATTGSEWLGELGKAVREVRRRSRLEERLDDALKAIEATARSRKPYRSSS